MYALVLFRAKSANRSNDALDREHVRFIEALARENAILLGGDFAAPTGGYAFAYVLKCESMNAARTLASREPYLSKGAYEADIVEWQLVGINTAAIDPVLAEPW